MSRFDEALMDRLAKAVWVGWFVGDEKTNAETVESLTKTAERYWDRNILISGGRESWPPAVRSILAALSETHLILPKPVATEGERDAAKDLERCEAARPGPWKVHNDNEGTEYPPFWVIGKDVDEDDEGAMELHVGDEATADFVAESRTSEPYWIKRCLQAEELVRLVRENHVLEDICDDNCGWEYGSERCEADDRCLTTRRLRRIFDTYPNPKEDAPHA